MGYLEPDMEICLPVTPEDASAAQTSKSLLFVPLCLQSSNPKKSTAQACEDRPATTTLMRVFSECLLLAFVTNCLVLACSLGGNTKTLMVAAISPADYNFEETLSTLR